MADFASGTWNLTHTENLDEYMKAVGVGYMGRKIAATVTPTQEISVQGGNWTIRTITTFRTSVSQFTLNEPFDEDTADGRRTKSVARLEGQKLTQEQKGTPDSLVTRVFDGNTMTMTLNAKGVTATRVYHRHTDPQ
ncbi:sodium/calcium exchanger regulatory protein 1-like [Babylonia areolata]|uniref:sodium/calcium exchanger regulatory protein 1-like n=1 Tax=Babylonia areolata TaxID=304850 RepID=UPI003FD4A7C0